MSPLPLRPKFLLRPRGYGRASQARRDKTLDQGAVEFYRLRIFLETDPTFDLNSMKRVVHHLHPSFQNPDRAVLDAETQFEKYRLYSLSWLSGAS